MSYCFLAALCVQVACGQLTWNGPVGAAWDAAGEHWLDAGGQPTVWRDGETAVIPGGVTVPVSGHFRVAGITFSGDRAFLAGVGTLRLDGDIATAAGTLNAISTAVTTDTAIRKTGAGTLAASALKGTVRVAGGTLVAGGSDFQNVDLQVADGASFSLLGIVSKQGNLLVNGSFEEPFYEGHHYVTGESVPTGWEVPEGNNYINHQNKTGSGTWSNGDFGGTTDIPDGDMMLVVQNVGEISQTVTVAEGGLYDLSMIHFRRSATGTYFNHVVYISVDGVPVRVLNTRNISSDWWRFSTGPMLLAAGSHTITFRGEGMWGDNSTFIDDVRFGTPTETEPTVAMTATSSLAAEAGATVNLNFTGSMVEHTLRPTLDLSRFDLSATVTQTGPGTAQLDPFGYLARENGGIWSSATTWADNHAPLFGGSPAGSLAFPLTADTTYTSDLGEYILNRLTLSGTDSAAPVTFAGNGLIFTNQNGLTRSMSYLTKRGSGAAILSMPLSVSTFLTIDVEGSLDVIQPITATTTALRAYKTGTGLLTLRGDTSGFDMFTVMEGTCIADITAGITPALEIRGTQYSVPALYFRYTGDYSTDRDFNLLAGGTAILGTMGNGHVYLMDSTVICGAPLGVFDIGAGDTFITKRVRRLVADSNKLMADSDILKIGPGTLRFTKRDTGNGSFTGAMIVRDGALELAASDLASGALNPLTGTSEVAFPLIGATITTPLVLSDEATEGTADIAFRLVEDHVMTARPIRIGPQARSVTLEQTEGTGIMSGEITLARSDLTIGGSAQSELALGGLTLEDVSSATVTVADGLKLTFDGDLTGIFNVTAPSGVSAGFNRSKQLAVSSLTLSGETTISFDANGNDCFHVGHLTISDILLIHLRNDLTGEEGYGYPGSYTLFTYDTFTGSKDNLTLASASESSGYSYSLGDTGNAIILTIRSAGDNPNYTWINDGDGEWKDAGNWDHDTAPNLADLTVAFGPAATQPVTVTLDDSFMFGDMVFANAHGFTLTGGALQFLKSGTPSITVEAGSHTIMSAITNNTAQELQIKTTGAGSLKLGGAIKSDIDVIGSSISFTDTATINGRLTLDEDSVLAVSDTVKLATTGNSTLMGDISGNGTLVKDGSSTLRVEREALSFTGTTKVEGGALEMTGVYPGTVELGANGTIRNDGTPHGLSVTSYKLPSTDSKNLFNYMYGVYESYIMFDRLVRTYNRTGSFIYNYPSGLIFS
ncbi:MAG: hypothetical protein J6U40_11850, partial [Kiritimatiellae bacterium]|nr:hypothetical protein [Kiritimatiellia bacterium]